MSSSQRNSLSKSVLESRECLLGKTNAFLEPLSLEGVIAESLLQILT